MRRKSRDKSKITVVASEEIEGMRRVSGVLTKKLEIDVDQLAVNINVFLEQMGEVLTKTPDTIGTYQLDEIEVSAEISAKGQVVLWGVGGEAGAGGGIKFVFKRGSFPEA